jgi:hypothetical protein
MSKNGLIGSIKAQRKLGVDAENGHSRLRVVHGKRKGQTPRIIVRCGCCREKESVLEIHYYEDGQGLEINGINGSIENWREVLLPLMGIVHDGKGSFVIEK